MKGVLSYCDSTFQGPVDLPRNRCCRPRLEHCARAKARREGGGFAGTETPEFGGKWRSDRDLSDIGSALARSRSKGLGNLAQGVFNIGWADYSFPLILTFLKARLIAENTIRVRELSK